MQLLWTGYWPFHSTIRPTLPGQRVTYRYRSPVESVHEVLNEH